jgi:L-galactono-1,4-lactone dehydrogenase
LSPAYSPNAQDIFSWVGVIMYITPEEKEAAIRQKFKEYAMQHADLTFKYGGVFHWGKVDLAFHEGQRRLEDLRSNFRERFDVQSFVEARRRLDPNNILGNRLIDTIFKA